MSNRDSLGVGEFLPQDVVDVLSQDKQGKKSQKKRSRSLGRALGWLKGRKRKDLGNNGKNLGLGPALDLALNVHPVGHKGGLRLGNKSHPQTNSHANVARDDDRTPAPPLLQENVFIESSRPKYLEDLHTEAMEGLKMMQEEETNIRGEYDTESIISSTTVQTDGEGAGFLTDSTIPDSSSVISTRSSVSTKSSRSGLTRQASTFRPLNSGKKSKSKKRERKAAAGIPRHVQRELGLDRVGWTVDQKSEEDQLYNGDSEYSPTGLSPQQESPDRAYTSLHSANAPHPLSKEKIKQLNAAHMGHRDDLALLQSVNPDVADEQRPRSMAVPWMTTTSELPSPVMSMSPQAAYMSKIIPNAVLPPSIDVVEISRGRSRNSVRTVSKSSLVLSSPAPSRASSRASSTRTISSQGTNMSSASQQNPHCLSDSNWSNSDSSETLVSDSSTISNTSTSKQKRSQDTGASPTNIDKVSTSNGKILSDRDNSKVDGQFGRSLSVIKPKRAPPPPSRSYSLHTKMKRRSRDLTDVRIIQGKNPTPSVPTQVKGGEKKTSGSSSVLHGIVDNRGYTSDASTKSEKNMIISQPSGYSSHDGVTQQALKQTSSSSPKPKKGLLAKLQKLFPGPSSTHANHSHCKEARPDVCDTASVSPSVQTLMELFNIPPHPKVRAPPPPPPEVWAHSKRSFELLLGPPAPDNIYAIIKKNPKDRRQQRVSPSVSTESSVKSLVGERISKGSAVESANGTVQILETKKVEEMLITEIKKDDTERLSQNIELKVSKSEEKMRGTDILHGMLAKAVEKHKERLGAKKEDEIKVNGEALATISLVHNSPSQSPSLGHYPVQSPPTVTTVVIGSESSWPPPPPPMSQVSVVATDELDFPVPPPPVEVLMFPDQVNQTVHVIQGVDPQTHVTSQQEVSPLLNIPPPPSYAAPPPPTAAVLPPTVNIVPAPPRDVILLVPKEVSPPPPPAEDMSLRLKGSPEYMVQFSAPHVIEPPPLPPEHIPPPPPLEKVTDEATLVSKFTPPQSIPPPPSLILLKDSSQQESEVKDQHIQRAVIVSSEASLPPAPKLVSVSETTHKTVVTPPVSILPAEPMSKPCALSSKTQSQEQSSSPVKQEEAASHVITTSLLQRVKLRSINSSPESPKAQEPSHTEVSLPKQGCDNEVQASPAHSEAPQKPIRRSLIMLSPTPTSPSAAGPSLPTSPKSETVVIPSVASSTTVSVMEASPNTSASVLSSYVSPPVVSIVEQSIPTTASPVVTPPVPTSTDTDAVDKSSTTSSVATTSTVISSVEQISSQTITSPSVVAAPVPSVPVVSTVESCPAPSVDSQSTVTPTVVSPVVNPAPKSPPTVVASAASSSTVLSVTERSPAFAVSSVVTPSVSLSIDASAVETSPPKSVSLPVVTPSVLPPPDEKPPAPTAAPLVVNPPPLSATLISSPVSTAPPKIVVSPVTSTTVVPAVANTAAKTSPSAVTPPLTLATTSPVRKSATTTPAASMKLQEAIRLRTEARSKGSPGTRLSMHSPTSPKDFRKSPTSTASFIFSKSTKKVVIESKPISKAKEDIHVNQQPSASAKAMGELEAQTGLKVPPPVARKPKAREKEVENSEVTEQTAGQEARRDTVKDDRERTKGTAGTVEGRGT